MSVEVAVAAALKLTKKKTDEKIMNEFFSSVSTYFFTIAADGGGAGVCTCKVVSPLAPVFVPIFL